MNEGKNQDREKNSVFLANSAKRPMYLVHVLGRDCKGDVSEFYVSSKLMFDLSTLKIQGYKIPKNKTVKNIEDVEKHVEREQYLDIHFPWQRVININNLTFKRKV